jgi:hypothetical protein
VATQRIIYDVEFLYIGGGLTHTAGKPP